MDSSASSPAPAPPPSSASSSTAPRPLGPPPASPRPLTRSEPANPYPTTFVQADTSSFKQVVQMLTGSRSGSSSPRPDSVQQPGSSSPAVSSRLHSIPPIKPGIAKKSGSGSSGFKLYERRNSLKNLNLNPLHPLSAFSGQSGSGFAGLKPEILSPSILDFPALVLSPVTPLTHDLFTRSPTILGQNCHTAYNRASPDDRSMGSASPSVVGTEAEEREIREKGFFLHPSPSTTPRDAKPRLLPLFPVTSPRVCGE